MAYSFQTFSVGQVLQASHMNQVEVNVRDHVHGLNSVSDNISSLTEGTTFDYDSDYVAVYDDSATAVRKWRTSALNSHRKNVIINGDFNVWQRGTSFTAPANNDYTADRWQYNKTGAMVHDVSRSTDVPTVAQAGRLYNYSLLVDCTTADSSIAAGDFTVIQHKVEGYNWLPLAQRAFTLQFWVKATKTGTYCVAVRNSGADRTWAAEYTIAAADTWEKKSLTFTASPSAGTWDYTTGEGLTIAWALAAGSDFQTTGGSWQTTTGAVFATANQVNACDSTDNNFQLCGVQLEVGSVATEFEQRAFQDELALCQRYFEKTFLYATAPAQNAGVDGAITWLHQVSGVGGPEVTWNFKVEKRAVPSVTFYNPSNTNANWYSVSGEIGAAVSTAYGTGNITIAPATNGTVGARYQIHASANSEL